jgi:Tol biopolymer transport system component
LFIRANTLMALPFDMARAEPAGEAVPLADDVRPTTNVSYAPVTVSDTGDVLFLRAPPLGLALVDREGARIDPSDEPIAGAQGSFSPDGRSLAFQHARTAGARPFIWIRDLARRTDRPLTTGSVGLDSAPFWSPDGERVVFSSIRDGGVFNLYQRAVAGAQDELLYANANPKHASDWSRGPDGGYIVFDERDSKTQRDLWVLPMQGSARTPDPFLRSPADESSGVLSPDGRWMAYTSDESGQPEVYVRGFPRGEGPWRISSSGGREPRWRGDGGELYFRSGSDLMAVSIGTAPGVQSTIRAEQPRLLFRSIGTGEVSYSVSADGQRFLVVAPARDDPSGPQLDVLLNWEAALPAPPSTR